MALQKFIFKIHSTRLIHAGYDLHVTLDDARKNDEIISMADSTILRWIDELNGVTDAEDRARGIKQMIRDLKREKNTAATRREIRKLYAELDSVQFKPDYVEIIMDKPKHYWSLHENGFNINGIPYQRLLATSGGVKNSTVVFVSCRLHDELLRRIDNGRDMTKPFVTAKLQAYMALVCSGSNPVSMPHGVLVVHDLETTFKDTVISLNNDVEGEPLVTLPHEEEVTINASDGFGLMLPSLAERWSEELGLDYVMGGCNTRFAAFSKGMVFAFDFVEFAEKVAGGYIVKDAWGDEVDIRNVELILTESVVKLWDSYESCEDYVRNCEENKYTVGITKVCPKELENRRTLNYQFIQPYSLTDDEIDELISPAINEFKDVLGGDWRKMVLFMRGDGMDDLNVTHMEADWMKACLVDHNIANDPYVQDCVYQNVKNRIKDAKVGVIPVHGNYSIACGDPYALCQSIFGLGVTGILKPREIYNKYWVDNSTGDLVCYRAPMSCVNNIRRVRVNRTDEAAHWFRYMPTATVFSCWSTECPAMNGMD